MKPALPSRPFVALLFLLLAGSPLLAQQGTIRSVYGSRFVFYGNNGPAVDVPLGFPHAVALDSQGNLYVPDMNNWVVEKITPAGVLTIVAGMPGSNGFAGDGGPATSAKLSSPYDVAVDGAGNIFIADFSNCRIRKVDTSGTISTIAGNGTCTYAGDNVQALSASLRPYGLALDGTGTKLYVADGNGYVRVIDLGTGIITTIAGGGSAVSYGGPATATKLYSPSRAIPRPNGDLYIADYNQIVKVAGGIVTAVVPYHASTNCSIDGFNGDNIDAGAATVCSAWGLAVDALGQLYIGDAGNQRLRKIDTGNVITTIAGTGVAGHSGDGGLAINAKLNAPQGPAVDSSGNVYFADYRNARIRRVSAGVITNFAGNGGYGYGGDGGPASAAFFYTPRQIAFNPTGELLIADYAANRIRKVDTAGNVSTIAGTGSPAFWGDGGPAVAADLSAPTGIASDPLGNVSIADNGNYRIRKIDTSGNISTFAGTGANAVSGDGGQATAADIGQPGFLSFANGKLYFGGGARVRAIDTSTGIITTVAGTGTSGYGPDGAAATTSLIASGSYPLADSSGNFYIADSTRIRKVDSSGIISTIAGTGTLGFSGDGGPATSAQIRSPSGLALDTHGNLFFVDSGNNRVRVITPTGTIATVGGTGVAGMAGDGGPAALAQFWFLNGEGGLLSDPVTGNLYVTARGLSVIRMIEGASNPGYLLAVTPASETANAGQTLTYTVSVVPISGWTGTVTPSCSALPAGTGCSFSPTSLVITSAAPVTATLTLTTSLSTPTTATQFTVTGDGGAQTSSAPAALVLGSLSPSSAVAVGPGFTLTVNGMGFVSGSVVRWNGSDRTTTFVNDTQLTAAITAADIVVAGSALVTVFDPSTSTATFPLPFTIAGLATCAATPSGLFAWWRAESNPNDTAYGMAGTMLGGATYAPGKVGQAFSLNGSSAYLSVPDSPLWAFGSGDFSIALWANWNSVSSSTLSQPTSTLVANDEGQFNLNKWLFEYGGGLLAFHINSPTIGPKWLAQAAFTPAPGTWYHLAVTRTNGTYRIYVNGVQLSSEGGTDAIPDAAGPLTIGQAEGFGYHNGLLDEVQIHRRALSLAEIQAMVNAGSFGTCTNLTYSAGADFSTATNPNGPWAYGKLSQVIGGNFTLLTVLMTSVPGMTYWFVGPDMPGVGYNAGSTNAQWLSISVPPGMVALDPRTEYPAARWTAPVGGTYSISGSFQGLDYVGPTTTDVHLVLNSSRSLFDANIASYNQPVNFSNTVAMQAGGTLDFVVGQGTGGYSFDNTGLLVTITNVSSSAPAPAVTSLSPPSATAGSGAFTLTVNGSNFVLGSTVRWNGSDRTTTFVSGTRLTAAISANDTTLMGSAQVSVFTPGVGASAPASFAINGSATCVAVPPGLVSWWRAEGDMNDALGLNPATVNGPGVFAAGLAGQALQFNGTSVDAKVAASPSLDVGTGAGLTLQAWIKPTDVNSAHAIFEWGNAGAWGTQLWIAGYYGALGGPTTLFGNLIDTGGNYHIIASAAGALTANAWQHVAVTYDKVSGVGTLYVNGAIVAQQNLGSFTPQTTYDLYLGLRPAGAPPAWYSGLMDEIAIYSRALSTAEIQAVYNSGNFGSCVTSLSADLALTGTAPSSAIVGSSVNYTITVTNNGPSAASGIAVNLTRPASFTPVSLTPSQGSCALGQTTTATCNLGSIVAGGAATVSGVVIPTAAGNYSLSGTVSAFIADPNIANNGITPGITVFPTGTCALAPPGLISLWRGEGNASDAQGVNPASLQGGVSFPAGQMGQAFSLDGSSGYVSVPDSPSLRPTTGLTLAGWFNFRSMPPGLAVLMGKTAGTGNSDTFVLWYTSGTLRVATGGPGGSPGVITYPFALALNTWYHIAYTYDALSQGHVLYVNGTPVASSITPVTVQYDSHPWIIGAEIESEVVSYFFPGLIDEAAIYGRALSATEITGLFTAGSAGICTSGLNACFPPLAGLVSWWPAEGNLSDLFGANHGTLAGGYSTVSGKVGQALQFNGVSGYGKFAASSSLDVGAGPGLTIEAWINPADVSSPHPIVEWNNGTGWYGPHFWTYNSGALLANLTGGGSDLVLLSSAGVLTANTWQHVAVTFDKASGATTLFVNGSVVAQTVFLATRPATTYDLYFARRPSGPNFVQYTAVTLDEIGLYGRALTPPEIQAIYTAASAGSCSVTPNPAPDITSLDPVSIAAGSAGFTLTVDGGNFVPGATVLWNGAPRPTTFVSDAQVTAAISNTDLAAAGGVPVSVQNPPPGGGESTPLTFIVANGYVLGTNLLANPDAEAGPGGDGFTTVFVPGWTVANGFTVGQYAPGYITATDLGPSSRGANVFAGGAGRNGTALQMIDLSAGAATIDTGTLGYYLSGYLGGWQAMDDSAIVTAIFKDADYSPLGRAVIGPVSSVDRDTTTGMMRRSVAGRLPAGTRAVEVLVEMTASGGDYSNAFADNLVFGIHHAYIVGDTSGSTGDAVGQFGDGVLNNVDLVQLFRTVTLALPRPPVCSDRFAAMDAYPPDSADALGGDGYLDNMDLIALLDRVAGLDTQRPIRPGRVATCTARSTPELFAGHSGTFAWALDGQLELGTPVSSAPGTWRVPIRLVAHTDLELTGLSYSVTLPGYEGTLRFVAADAGQPSLLDSGIPGTLAAGWLRGLKVRSGTQLLLGYAEVSGWNLPPQLRINGVVANAAGTGKSVPIGFSSPAAAPARGSELQ